MDKGRRGVAGLPAEKARLSPGGVPLEIKRGEKMQQRDLRRGYRRREPETTMSGGKKEKKVKRYASL